MFKKLIPLAAVLLTLSACGSAKSGHPSSAPDTPDLEQAYQTCIETADMSVQGRYDLVGSDQIVVKGAASKSDFLALHCLFEELDTPPKLWADLSVATTQSGSNSLDADGLHYAWSIQLDGIMTSYAALHMNISKSS